MLHQRLEIIVSIAVFVGVCSNPLLPEIDYVDVRVSGDAVHQLARVSMTARAGK
jgi:hypothetical protein